MADPLRMSMMYTLSRRTGHGLPAMSVKELAAALGEPKTKLYRHVKQLESAGLIVAVSSRVVSGIVEQRYQAAGPAVFKGDEVSPEERTSPEAEAMVAAALEIFRREYFGVLRSSDESEPGQPAAGPRACCRCSRSPTGKFRPPGSPPSTISSGRWWTRSAPSPPPVRTTWCRSNCSSATSARSRRSPDRAGRSGLRRSRQN